MLIYARGSTARVMLIYARGSTARVVLIERMHKGLGPCSHCTADERRALLDIRLCALVCSHDEQSAEY